MICSQQYYRANLKGTINMIEQFLQRKLANLVDQYIEFQKLMLITAEGMTIKNSKIKPKLTQLLSQVLHIPLQLVSGSISSLTLNKPWEKLFFFMNSPIKIAIENVHIRTRLSTSVNEEYLLKNKQKLIERITEGLFNPLQAILHHNHSYINIKLKEYFLSTIILEVKNVCFEIQVDLKQKIVLVLKIDNLKFRKQDKRADERQRIHLEITGVGVYYKALGEKQVEFISPTKIEFERIKTENSLTHKRSSIKTLKIQRLQFNVNNINYGDIARIILMIDWHNSFNGLSYNLWRQKPFILSEVRPIKKFQYTVHLIKDSFKQANFRKQLNERKLYIDLYLQLLTKASQFGPQDKLDLCKMEKEMPVWKIIAYRSCCINIYKNKILAKKKKAQELQNSLSQKKQWLAKTGWFLSWSASEKNKDQLQQQFLNKMDTINFLPDDIQSIFYVSVDKLKVKLSIVTQFGIQPFISIVGTDCSFKNTESLLQKTWQKNIEIIRCKVQYEKYLGHSERYRNFISECKEHLDQSQPELNGKQELNDGQDDQFEEVGKFLQINFKHDSKVIAINLLPFDIFINHDVIQKFSILLNIQDLSKLTKIAKIQQNFINRTDPWCLVEKQKQKIIELKRSQNSQSIKLSGSFNNKAEVNSENTINLERLQSQIKQKAQQKEITIKTTFNIIIPYDLRSAKTSELVIQIGQLFFSKKDITKTIQLKGIMVKYKMPERQDSEDEQYKHIVNFLAPRMQQKIIVRKFNLKMIFQKHVGFDNSLITVDSVNIQLPPQYYLFSLIQLVYLHIPKSKQSRAKQYFRRKQSIGQQFIDACQNLKEHIAKSMIMSSEKLTKKSIIHQKRTKQQKIVLKGMNITQKDFQLLLGQIIIDKNEASYDNQTISSHNYKMMKISIHNYRRFIENMKNIKLHITKQSIKRGLNNQKQKGSGTMSYLNVQLTQMNLQVVISLKKSKHGNNPSIKMQVKDFSFFNNIEGNYKSLQTNITLFYDEQIPDSQRFTSVPFIEPCQITYRQITQFNLLKRTLNIDKMSINIKPSLFKFIAKALKDYYLEEQTKCNVINGTINTIKIKKSHQNYYSEYKLNQKLTTENYYCEMLLFGTKSQLQFNQHHQDIPKQKIQCIQISNNNFLINKQTSPNNYILQSNIRILNHQDKTLWLKITENSSSIITPDYQQQVKTLKRLSHTPKRHFNIDLTQRIQEQQLFRDSLSKTASKKRNSYSTQVQKLRNNGKTFNIALKPKQKVHILIDSNDHKFLQILDQGVNFTEIYINELFEQNEKVLKGQGEYQDQYLVIRSQISSKEGVNGSIYTFHIYSPIYIVNKTPWELQYRLSQEKINLEQDDNRRIGRRRSFQLVPLKKIPILSSEKIRNIHYNQIQTMKLQLNKCERQINSLLNLIASIKQRNDANHDGFMKQTKLITLRHNKKEIQLILALQFSANILKIKIYPQIVFINLTKQVIRFKIKEDQIAYPQITLSSINLNSKSQNPKLSKSKSKSKQKQKQKILEHISQYINISDEKIKEREALKQLFQNFSNSLQIFTGKIQEQEKKNLTESNRSKRKLLYNTTFINSNSIQMKLLGRSSKGYLSDYGSDGQFREQLTDFTEQPLQEQNLLIYSDQKFVFYKRVLNIQGYFNLILISPTVHIINKSQATFYAKSSCQNLVIINKNDHHFIHINQNTIDIQASFVDEQISLNEWMRLDLTRLGTIYYSKDMIQHHGSGYQSKQYTLRKRRMKKTPKIFYRVLLCKFERGQKILIEQSQYPPYSFLNNTDYRIKIQEPNEHFIEEFVNKGDMGEYAPKYPYYSPRFKLYVAQGYEYKMLLQFQVDKRETYNLEKDIIVSVQQYKDKTIVQIKNKKEINQNANLTMSILQRSQGYQYNNLLEETTKFTFTIHQMSINVLNNWNRQLNINLIQGVSLIYQNKNYKDYYKFEITNVEGYDYMDIKPDFIFKRKKKEKSRLSLLHKQKAHNQIFLTFQLVTNYHKNALIIEKCYIKLDEIVFYLSADLILAYVKNYYQPIYNLIKVHQYYENHHVQNKSGIASKTFIFQSLDWNGTSLKIQTRNLSIMETFLNKQYQKWLVKFINWLGDIKPIGIEPLKLTYQQITLRKLRKHINLKKKAAEIVQQLMDYPLSQLKDVILFFIGEENRNMKQKLNLFYNLAKSLEYIVNFTLSLNENLKSKLKTYNEVFAQNHKQNFDIIDKMINFEYCQWKYKKDHLSSKLDKKIKRLQRYNTRNAILPYDEFKAKIKLAMDSYLQNKLFKKIEHVYRINSDYIFSVVLQFAIIYSLADNQWIVVPVQYLIGFCLNKGDIQITYLEEQPQKQFKGKQSNIRTKVFKNIQINEDHVQKIKRLLQVNKLSSYY